MSEFHQPIATDAEHIDIDHIVDTIAVQSDSGPQFIHVGGVSSAGKSTVSRFIASELPDAQILSIDSYLVEGLGRGEHDFNDTSPDPSDPYIGGIDERITASSPEIEPAQREKLKLNIGNDVLERLASETSGRIIIDASCDRGYDDYRAWAEKRGYRVILLRMDVPRDVIEQRIRERGNQGYRSVENSLAHLDTWWQQWEAFGREHTPDIVVTPDTPVKDIIRAIENKLQP